jgi:Protein of unknown function (DUF3800)
MLTAYLDESAHETENVIVAGFLGNDDQWEQCAEQWRIGLGKRKYLHMKDLRFKKQRVRELLERLGPIPHECGLRTLVATVPVSSYYDLVSNTRAERLTKGYYFCLITILDAIVKNTPKDESVKLVCELQNEYEIGARRFFDDNKHHLTSAGEPKFNSIEFISKDSSILTQPADYLAFSILQVFRDPESLKSKWCEPIRRNTQPGFGFIHDGKGLRDVVKSSLRKMPEFARRIIK